MKKKVVILAVVFVMGILANIPKVPKQETAEEHNANLVEITVECSYPNTTTIVDDAEVTVTRICVTRREPRQ